MYVRRPRVCVCASAYVLYSMDVGCRLVINNNNDTRKTRKFIHIKSVDNYNFIAMPTSGSDSDSDAGGSKKGESESGRQINSVWMRTSECKRLCIV